MRQSRRIMRLLLPACLVFSLVMAGCNKESVTNEIVSRGPGAISGMVTIAGSTSAQTLSQDLGSIFMTKNPKVLINVSGGDTALGIQATQNKTVDFGAVSRELRPEETGLVAVKIAYDGLAIVVNRNNPVSELTIEQIQGIYNGKMTNWNQVGGKDAPILLLNREEGSGTLEVFRDKLLGKEAGKAGTVCNSSSAVVEAVSNNQNAVGYVSFSAVDDKVKDLKINGVELTVKTMKEKKYPLIRPLYYVYSESSPLSEQAQSFLNFIFSEEGQRIIGTHGYSPLS
ncbi:phosphate binding protein [Syntrophobotulus glycolicus DSM 8271]|uniref:Phosphate-binding protein n=1 Tax=Syntrophobotulus glycolicus (strain DSM 8271 / FlGlyR) TaxID=645991 RepID=F0STY1_SYNGF|nr:phosphate ABC transporter substrate-binding protein [Syntrophobotulus glycolicus]ADY56504.1 phosphate binding protein [Syntrophobotulus glycolicus DSM 8271]